MKQTLRLRNKVKPRPAGANATQPPFPTPCRTCWPDIIPPAPPACVHDRLAVVTNWPERAQAAHYRAQDLAQLCGASLRELQRFFVCHTGHGPHQWLNELRQTEGLALLAAGHLVKQSAHTLHYLDPAHFSRDFKRFYGLPPTATHSMTGLRALLGQTVCRVLAAHCRVLAHVRARAASPAC